MTLFLFPTSSSSRTHYAVPKPGLPFFARPLIRLKHLEGPAGELQSQAILVYRVERQCVYVYDLIMLRARMATMGVALLHVRVEGYRLPQLQVGRPNGSDCRYVLALP